MSKLKKIKTFLLFGLIAIVSIAGFRVVENGLARQDNISTTKIEQNNVGASNLFETAVIDGVTWNLIQGGDDLRRISQAINQNPANAAANYKLCDDVLINGDTWMPIGYNYGEDESGNGTSTSVTAFTGVFDGNGHTVTFSINNRDNPVEINWREWNADKGKYAYLYDYNTDGDVLAFNNDSAPGIRGYGLFAWVKADGTTSSRVRNLNVDCQATVYFKNVEMNYVGYNGTLAFGGVAGLVTSDSIVYPAIEQCKVDVNVTVVADYALAATRYSVGGVAGFVRNAKIVDCRVNITNIAVDARYNFQWGGFWGYAENISSQLLYFFLGGIAGCVQNAYLGTSLVISGSSPFDVKTLQNAVDTWYPLNKTIHMLYGFKNNKSGYAAYDNAVTGDVDGTVGGNRTQTEGTSFDYKYNGASHDLEASASASCYETSSGEWFYDEQYKYSSNVHTTWVNKSTNVWWKLDGVEECATYPIQRAFLPIEEITFYNTVDDSHGVHSVKYAEKVGDKVEVISGYSECTWKWIYDQLGDSNLTHKGYVFGGGIITTTDGGDTTFARNSTTVYEAYYWENDWLDYRGDQIWLKPQRHVGLVWTKLTGYLQFTIDPLTTSFGTKFDGASWNTLKKLEKFKGYEDGIPIDGVLELKQMYDSSTALVGGNGKCAYLDNILAVINEYLATERSDSLKGRYCVDYVWYYNEDGYKNAETAMKYDNGSVALTTNQNSRSGIKYKKNGSGTWYTNSLWDVYMDEGKSGKAITMKVVLKEVSLDVTTTNYAVNGAGSENNRIEIPATAGDVAFNNKTYLPFSTGGTQGVVLRGWSINKKTTGDWKDFNRGRDNMSLTQTIYSSYRPGQYYYYKLSIGRFDRQLTGYITAIDASNGGSEIAPTLYLYPVIEFRYQWYNPISVGNDTNGNALYKQDTNTNLGALETYTEGNYYSGANKFPTIKYNDIEYTNFLVYNEYWSGTNGIGSPSYNASVDTFYVTKKTGSGTIYKAGDTIPLSDGCEGKLHILPIRYEFVWVNPTAKSTTSSYHNEWDGSTDSKFASATTSRTWTGVTTYGIPIDYMVGEKFPTIIYRGTTYTKFMVYHPDKNTTDSGLIFSEENEGYRQKNNGKTYTVNDTIPTWCTDKIAIMPIETIVWEIEYYIPTLQEVITGTYGNTEHILRPKLAYVQTIDEDSFSSYYDREGFYDITLLDPWNKSELQRDYYTPRYKWAVLIYDWEKEDYIWMDNTPDYANYYSAGVSYNISNGTTTTTAGTGQDPFDSTYGRTQIDGSEVKFGDLYVTRSVTIEAYLMLYSWTEYTMEFWRGCETDGGTKIAGADKTYKICEMQGTGSVAGFAGTTGKARLSWASSNVPTFNVYPDDEQKLYNSYVSVYNPSAHEVYTKNGSEYGFLVTNFASAGISHSNTCNSANKLSIHIVIEDWPTEEIEVRYNYNGTGTYSNGTISNWEIGNTNDIVEYFDDNPITRGNELPNRSKMQTYMNGINYTNLGAGHYYDVITQTGDANYYMARYVLGVDTIYGSGNNVGTRSAGTVIKELYTGEVAKNGGKLIIYLWITNLSSTTTFDLYEYKDPSGTLKSGTSSGGVSTNAVGTYTLSSWETGNSSTSLSNWAVENATSTTTTATWKLQDLYAKYTSFTFGSGATGAVFLGFKNDQGVFIKDDNGLIKFNNTSPYSWKLSSGSTTGTINVYGVWGMQLTLLNADGSLFYDATAPHWKNALKNRADNGLYCYVSADNVVYSGSIISLKDGRFAYDSLHTDTSRMLAGLVLYDVNMPIMIQGGTWKVVSNGSTFDGTYKGPITKNGVQYFRFGGNKSSNYYGTTDGLKYGYRSYKVWKFCDSATLQLVSNITYEFTGWTYTQNSSSTSYTEVLPWRGTSESALTLITSDKMSHPSGYTFLGWGLKNPSNYQAINKTFSNDDWQNAFNYVSLNSVSRIEAIEINGYSGVLEVRESTNSSSRYELTYVNGCITQVKNIGTGSSITVTIKDEEPPPPPTEYKIIYIGGWNGIVNNSTALTYRKTGEKGITRYFTISGTDTKFDNCATQTYTSGDNVTLWGYTYGPEANPRIFSDCAGGDDYKGGNIFKGWRIVAISEDGNTWITSNVDNTSEQYSAMLTASGWGTDRYIPYGMGSNTDTYSGKQYNIIMLAEFENILTLDPTGGTIKENYSRSGWRDGNDTITTYDANSKTYSYLSSSKDFKLPAYGYMEREGYVFLGWSASTTGSLVEVTEISSDTYHLLCTSQKNDFDDKWYITQIKTGSFGDRTLYAVWIEETEEETYTMTLQPNGATLTGEYLEGLLAGTTATYGGTGTADNGTTTYIIYYHTGDVFNLPTSVTLNGASQTVSNWKVTKSTKSESDTATIVSNTAPNVWSGNYPGWYTVTGWRMGDTYTQCSRKWGDVTLTIDNALFEEHIIYLNTYGGEIDTSDLASRGLNTDGKTLPYYDSATNEIHYVSANTFKLPKATREGYTFYRWCVKGVYTKDGYCGNLGGWTENSRYSYAANLTGKYGCVEMEASWKDNRLSTTYTLTLDPNGGVLSGYAPFNGGVPVYEIEVLSDNGVYKIAYTWSMKFNLPSVIYKNGEAIQISGSAWKVIASDQQEDKLELENGWSKGNHLTSSAWGWIVGQYEPRSTDGSGYDISSRIGNVTLQIDWSKLEQTKHYMELDLNGEGATVDIGGLASIDKDAITATTGSYYCTEENLICYDSLDTFTITPTRAGYTFAGWAIQAYSKTTPAGCGSLDKWGLTSGNDDPMQITWSDTTGIWTGTKLYDSNGEYAGLGYKVVDMYGCVKLVAQWTTTEYRITLNSNGGEIKTYSLQTKPTLPYYESTSGNIIHYSVANSFALPDYDKIQRAGYVFVGWKVTSAGGNWSENAIYAGTKFESGLKDIDGNSITSTNDLTIQNMYGTVELTALWKEQTYTITFKYGTTYADSNITIENCKFFSADSRVGIVFDDAYANVGKVTSSGTNTVTVIYGASSYGLLSTCSTDGYNFKGWIKDGDTSASKGYYLSQGTLSGNFKGVTTQYNATDEYYITSIKEGSQSNVTLIAVWERIPYTITLDLNGGTISGYSLESSPTLPYYNSTSKQITYAIDSDFVLPSSQVSKAGYVLQYWEVEGNVGNWKKEEQINGDNNWQVVGGYGNVSLKAHWKVINHYDIIKFDLNGGDSLTGEVTSEYVSYNVESIISLPGASREGYTFSKWTVSGLDCSSLHGTANCTCGKGNWSETEIDAGFVISGRYGCVTLTAVWKPNQYTILLDANSGAFDSTFSLGSAGDLPYYNKTERSITYTIECSDKIKLPTMKRTGYDFAGWKLVDDSADKNWAQADVDACAKNTGNNGVQGKYGNITIVAQWTPSTYVITLNGINNGTINYSNDQLSVSSSTIKYTIESKVTLPTIEWNGYTFTGWELTTSAGNWTQKDVNSCTYGSGMSGKYGNITLTAKRDIINYTVQYAVVPSSVKVSDLDVGTVAGYIKDGYETEYTIETKVNVLSELSNDDYFDIKRWNVIGDEHNWGTSVLAGEQEKGKYGDVILYQHGEFSPYQITLDANGGTIDERYATYLLEAGLVYSVSGNSIGYLQSSSSNIPMPAGDWVTQDGYILNGWLAKDYTSYNESTKTYIWKDGATTVAEIKCEMSGKYITQINAGSYGDVTLIAEWTTADDAITLDPCGGTIYNYSPYVPFNNNIITYTIIDKFDLPDYTQIIREGYTFEGWKVTSAGGNWQSGEIVTSVGARYGLVTLSAQWQINTYAIKLNVNGGKIENYSLGSPLEELYYKDRRIRYVVDSEAFELPTNANVKKNGYTFEGWTIYGADYTFEDNTYTLTENGAYVTKFKCEMSGKNSAYITKVLPGSFGDVLLLANWSLNEYNITLNAIGATINYELGDVNNLPYYNADAKTITYTINSGTFGLPADVTKGGHTFTGWKVTRTDDNSSWTAGATFLATSTMGVITGQFGNVTLTAQWDTPNYEITFDMNSTSLVSEAQLNYLGVGRTDDKDKVTYILEYSIGTAITLPVASNIVCNGYKFKGWVVTGYTSFDEATSTYTWKKGTKTIAEIQCEMSGDYATKMLAGSYGSVTLQARWELIQYTITYSASSGFGDSPTRDNIANYILTDPTRPLCSKCKANLTSQQVDNLQSTSRCPKCNAKLTLDEVWYLPKTATYNITEEFPTDVSLISEMTGYEVIASWNVFGYYTVSGNSNKFVLTEDEVKGNWSSPVAPTTDNPLTGLYGNVVLWVKLVPIEYTIVFDVGEDASINRAPILNYAGVESKGAGIYTYKYNIEKTIDLPNGNELSSVGYTFRGWVFDYDGKSYAIEDNTYTLKEGSEVVSLINCLTSGSYLTQLKKGSYGDIKLVASWDVVEYTIVYSILDADDEPNVANISNKLIKQDGSVYVYTYTIAQNIELKTVAEGYNNITEWSLFGYYTYSSSTGLSTLAGEVGNWESIVKVPTGSETLSGKYGNVVLYKQGDLTQYKVVLELGDGYIDSEFSYGSTSSAKLNISAGETSITYVFNKGSFRLPTVAYTKRTGCTFLGWELQGEYTFENISGTPTYTLVDKDGETIVLIKCRMSNGYITTINNGSLGDFTLTAVWEPIEYNITLDANGGEVLNAYADNFTDDMPTYSNGVIAYTVENSVALPTAIEMKAPDGYVFAGWVVSGDDAYATTEQFNPLCKFTFGQVGGLYYITGIEQGTYTDLSLTAIWLLGGYTIEYEVEVPVGEVEFTGAPQIYTISSEITLLDASTVVADAYELIGWKVKENVGNWVKGTIYEPSQVLTQKYGFISADGEETTVVLVAYYRAKTFTISFETGEFAGVTLNSNLTTINYTADQNFKFPALVNGDIPDWQKSGATRNGYEFQGWKVKENVGNWEQDSIVWQKDADASNIANKFGNVVLVPLWGLPTKYTLTIILDDGIISTPTLNSVETSSYEIEFTIVSAINLPSTNLNATGYIASHLVVTDGSGGWTIGATYELGKELTGMYGDATMKVVWTAREYSLYLDANNGQFTSVFIDEIETSGKFNGLNAQFDASKTSLTVTYTIENQFALPTNANITRRGMSLAGWSATADQGYEAEEESTFEYVLVQGEYYITGFKQGNSVSLKLYAQWTYIEYEITLLYNNGVDNGYSVFSDSDPQLKYLLNEAGGVITYTIRSQFDLPTSSHILRTGYTLRGWMVVEDTNGQTEYEQIIDKYNTSSYQKGEIDFVMTMASDGCYYITGINADSLGNATLIAIWEENQYKLVFSGAGETKTLKYTEVACLDVQPTLDNYVFIGWSEVVYSNPSYIDIYNNTTKEYLDPSQPLNKQVNGDVWELKILVVNSYVQSLSQGGDPYGTLPEFKINAVWLPVYNVTVHANDGQVYNNGVLEEGKTSFIAKNSYFDGYTLSNTPIAEIFNPPAEGTGYKLFRKGYSISGWVIKIGEIQYSVDATSVAEIPSISDWVKISAIVKCGINLQYLQGNISATPIWEAMKFDVVFKTTGDEAYKFGYNKEYRTRDVVYDSKYFFYPETNINVTGATPIQSSKIKGYSIAYVKPYTGSSEIQDKVIDASGTWGYADITYIQKGSTWEVWVEGYYTPVLYRNKINLDLPYSASVTVNGNNFTQTDASGITLNASYDRLTLDVLTYTYKQSQEYTEYQNKLFTNGDYYIYLLQDQAIYSKANSKDSTAVKLPTFEIDYYELQYYVLNGTADKYSYVTVEMLKVDEPINQPTDWKYTYCDANGVSGGTNFVFTAVWYRNVVNFEVRNVIEQQNSASGYVVVTENEKVTDTLSAHKSTHIIVFAWDSVNVRYKYYHFEFDGTYTQPISTILNYSATQLADNNIIKTENNIVVIYAGNQVEFSAYDQHLDSSLDDFVGYRFKQYSNSTDSTAYSTITELTTSSDLLESDTRYIVSAELSNYIEFEDKATVALNVEFTNIQYTLRYFIGDSTSDDVNDVYGKITISYRGRNLTGADITLDNCKVDVAQGLYPVQSVIKVNLGYELTRWVFIDNQGNKINLGEDGLDATNVAYQLVINPEFLRNKLYTGDYSNEPEQELGSVKAECEYILFNIQVHTVDASTGAELNSYQLTTDVASDVTLIDRALTQNCASVKLGDSYYIQFNPSQVDEDGKVYYEYNGNLFAYKDFYIERSLSHQQNKLITKFKYPATSLGGINLNVDETLLDATINYVAGLAVLEENRYLHFYIQVAPKAEMIFVVNADSADPCKGNRRLTVEGNEVVSATNGSALQVTNSYNGYITQEVEIKWVADARYYSSIELYLPSGQSVTINANGSIKFTIEQTPCKIIVNKVTPRTYNLTAYIEFDGNRYDVDDWQTIVNASGIRVVNSIEITGAKEYYYYGDAITVKYSLNGTDYIGSVTSNGVTKITAQSGECVVKFDDSNLEVLLQIERMSSKVIITTNIESEQIGEVYIEINGTQKTYIQSADSEQVTQQQFDLQAGDKVTVFLKTAFGYSFDREYDYALYSGDAGTTVISNGDTNRYSGYYHFNLFDEDNPYDSTLAGQYMLRFTQIFTKIELIYSISGRNYNSSQTFNFAYTLTDEDGQVNNSIGIDEGVRVTLTEDKYLDGYRFECYTYKEPYKNSGYIELGNDFVVDADITTYLSSIEARMEDERMVRKWYIYVNLVEQYTVTIKYRSDKQLVKTSVVDLENNEMQICEQQYQNGEWVTIGVSGGYDYNSVVLFNISAVDTEHYTVSATFDDFDDAYHPLLSTWSANRDRIVNYYGVDSTRLDNTHIYNRNNNLSGFVIPRVVETDLVVTITLYTERFNTILTEHYQTGLTDADIEDGNIYTISSGGEFGTQSNIEYAVEGSLYFGTKVKINIYTRIPVDKTEEMYYQLYSIKIAGQEIKLGEATKVTMNGKDYYMYTLEYEINGTTLGESKIDTDDREIDVVDTPNAVLLDITYKQMKKVQINIDN